ncbi:tyrosine-type recombinase/integrase [Lysinibacillus sphaericus]|uniref:tyrosine-type recombinase/integrase n=1 Tax=Lysinibacillus sphaericus TaxID=1421 RepID=UPI0018CD3714|nr:tyrosine-type recombinase/integrase [Lysinibacillus sphaericus]
MNQKLSFLEEIDALRMKYEQRLQRSKSDDTARTYKYEVRRYIRFLEEHELELKQESTQEYMNQCYDKKMAAVTINKIFRAIKNFAKEIERMDIVEDIRVVSPPNLKNQAPKSLREIERKKIMNEAQEDTLRNLAIITVLLNTGVRVSELVMLDRSDVIILDDEGEIKVRHGKGNKERDIPINKTTRDVLSMYLESRTDKSVALFYGRKGGRLGKRGVQHIMADYGVHAHKFRHTFITDLVRKQFDLVLIQTLSGHASMDILSRYARPSKEDLQGAVEKLYN